MSRSILRPALLVALALIVLDQFTKWLAIKYVKPIQTFSVISMGDEEILNFTYLENSGAAFSILQGRQLFLISVTCAFIILLISLLFTNKIKTKFLVWAASLVIAGGTGNLIDRVLNGYVVDFIDFRIIKFAVFNVADICAVTGALMMLVAILFQKPEMKSEDDKNIISDNISSGNSHSGFVFDDKKS